jgi:hypothetical protein
MVEQIVDEIIKNNAPQVAQFKSGNEKILGFFVGQAMKATTAPIAQLPCKMPKLMPCIDTGNWRHSLKRLLA